jgi:hypothetical protein
MSNVPAFANGMGKKGTKKRKKRLFMLHADAITSKSWRKKGSIHLLEQKRDKPKYDNASTHRFRSVLPYRLQVSMISKRNEKYEEQDLNEL